MRGRASHAARTTSGSRGCRSTTTWGSSASCSRRSITWCPIVYLPRAALSQAAGHLVPGDHAAPGLDRVRPELRLRALRQAHQAGRSRGARPLHLARRRLRRRADPPRDARGLRRDVRARSASSKEALLPSYGMAESSLAITFSELGEGVKTLGVNGPDALGAGAGAASSPRTTRTPCASCRAAPSSPSTRSGSSPPTTRRASGPLPEGKVGELRIAGPSVMRGYWEDAERTRDVLRRAGS